jgi:DNA-binding NtrC family response regulator
MAKVLIIEDETSLRDTLASFLGREGHEVIAAADGREAFDRAISARPDVLVTDWMLQNHIHGLQVSETFKAVNPTLHTILITGFPSQDLVAESNRSGVFQLLEKPFGLDVLRDAVSRAVKAERSPGRGRPIAVIGVDREGNIEFASDRALELFDQSGAGRGATHLQGLFSQEALDQIESALSDWVSVTPVGAKASRWLVRARPSADMNGYLMVICTEDEKVGINDPRISVLLNYWSRSKPILPDRGPVVVIEKDGAVRRLLVSQIERIGSLCYPTDDLDAALRLLSAEPRAVTVLLDFAVAGDQMSTWVEQIREVRPEVRIIGIGGAGSEDDLLAQGVERVLPKPWRIMDLLDVIAGTAAESAD